MTVADMKAAVALAVEQAMRLIATDTAPAVPAAKVVSPDVKAKRLAALEKARAAKKAKAKAAPAVKAAKPAAKADRTAGWDVKPHTTKRGVAGKIVRVGPFSAFIPNDDKAKRDAAIVAINSIFRTEEIKAVVAQF